MDAGVDAEGSGQEHEPAPCAQSNEPLSFEAIAAHQLRSPLSALGTMLQVLQAGYAGPVTDRQQEFLTRMDRRCQEMQRSIQRVLAVARCCAGAASSAQTDLATLVPRQEARWGQEALAHGQTLFTEIECESALVPGDEAVHIEILDALVGNAIKYTPEHGQIRVAVGPGPDGTKVHCAVADSGLGIPEADRDLVFQPFFRSQCVKQSTRTGSGMGLAFAKKAIDALGGSIAAGSADLGGAEILVQLPMASRSRQRRSSNVDHDLRVVIVGGVTAGPKVAAKVLRLRPAADVTVVERGEFLSYAGCGLPYYLSGMVRSQKELMVTPAGVVRDPVFFQRIKNFRAFSRTEAVAIDRQKHRVRIRSLADGCESWLEYDKLVLATGARPIRPDIPGVALGNVFTLHGVQDAEGIRGLLVTGKARDAVIVGGGLIGVEVAEALAARGCRLTIIEQRPCILPMLDCEMALLVERHLESHGVRVLTGARVTALEGDGVVERVVTDGGSLPAQLVILATGVRPNVELAEACGLTLGATGAIAVDASMVTSDPDIFAAGDCVESRDLITGRPIYMPLGSTASKQGRVAAVNLCGGRDRFSGIVGSVVCRAFGYCVARTGLGEAAAREAGFEPVSALVPGMDRAHFMPGADLLMLKVIVDAPSRRLLGAQAVGPSQCTKRIDVAALAISSGLTVDQLATADLCYAPPYSSAMDNLITAADVARNKLDGHLDGVSPLEVKRMLDEGRKFCFLDVRSPSEWEDLRLPGATLIPLGVLRARLDELPRDQEIVTFCNISLRGYEAALILRHAGFRQVKVMDGGIEMWPFEKTPWRSADAEAGSALRVASVGAAHR